jgi:hypothetical protein
VSSFQPVTLYVPFTADEPIEVNVAHSGLRMVLVNRDAIRRLSSDWRVLGVYFLLGPDPTSAERYRAYVGEVGRCNLLLRITEHAAHKDWWNRALLVASNSTNGFNSAEIGWLEGRFYDVLNNAVAATLMNRGRPGDDSIATKGRGVLERYVELTLAALRAVGASPDTADQKPAPGGKKRAHYRDDGSLEIDGSLFAAVSPAAQAVSGNQSEPGWEFWGAPSGDGRLVSLFELRDRLRADVANTTPTQQDRKRQSSEAAVSPDSGDPVGSKREIQRRPHRYGATLRELLAVGLITAGEALLPPPRGRSRFARVTHRRHHPGGPCRVRHAVGGR